MSTLNTDFYEDLTKIIFELEFMFMKHYAPNRCEPSIEALNFRGRWGSGQM